MTYVIQPRDTLWTIAENHLGDPMRYRDIITLNQGRTMNDGQPFNRGEWLQPGCILHLPADARKEPSKPEQARLQSTHTVASGETLWGISQQHLGKGAYYKAIFRLNKGRPQPGGAILAQINHDLTGLARVKAGRQPDPTASVIDTQSVKTSTNVPLNSQGADAANYLGLDVMPGKVDQGWPAKV
ncbi:LysM peptidoglycan-binding domain-containing protein [Nonomuraea sp. K274]|uniref:LysM peptidoglycan-binding domain-containing protein n=1 Tax=Nonomuraea cypriaca TaxID=1187855 RepID=A0A931A4U0_9ACTN|nr:LysM peptidoglycan-binding domain-containing protein [Nonomuraea cypriaca]